jgi:aromatic ring-opening dioxygenase catalytic subunit (LigB family)
MRLPTYFIPHGAGPCFFMAWTRGPADTWDATADWLKGLVAGLPERPKAVLVISGHWEAPVFTVGSGPAPELIFDYYGFPEETYRLRFDAPGSPQLAQRVRDLLDQAGLPAAEDPQRGYDHGVFVPLKLVLPAADIPVVQLSLRADLDPAAHLAAGRALAPLRDEGVLIVGSGMSWHNMRGFRRLALPGHDRPVRTRRGDPPLGRGALCARGPPSRGASGAAVRRRRRGRGRARPARLPRRGDGRGDLGLRLRRGLGLARARTGKV